MSGKLKMAEASSSPWYKDGLSFQCTECGKCCTGSPGYVWVTEKEIQAIADHLKLSVDKFSKRYLRQKEGRYALVELKRKNYDCIFLKDNKCSIYSARPTQCRTYPWWQANLNSKEAWENAAKTCEGIRDEAAKAPLEIIERELRTTINISDQGSHL